MHPEDAILLALNEPRTYTNLYHAAIDKRDEVGETLGKQTFVDALRHLMENNYVKSKKAEGRKVEYSLNPDLDPLGRLKMIEAIRTFQDAMKSVFDKADFSGAKKNKKMAKYEIEVFEAMTKVIMLLSGAHRFAWYMVHSSQVNDIEARHLRDEICQYEKIMSHTMKRLKKINRKLAQSLHVSVVRRMEKESKIIGT